VARSRCIDRRKQRSGGETIDGPATRNPEIWNESVEASMNTHIAPRLLIPVFALVLIVAGALSAPASARTQLDELSWSETESQENVLVQTCDGFDLTTSYTVNRDYHRFIDVSDNLNVEWVGVDFAGAIGNSVTGKSYAYDGKLMRWSDYDNNKTAITNLTLRFEVGAPGQFSVAIDRIELDRETDPSAVIKAFVPNALQMELCYLMAAPAPVEPFDPIANYAPGQWINVQAEDSALPESDGNQVDTCADLRRPGVPLAC
jgi:hypothetical protein